MAPPLLLPGLAHKEHVHKHSLHAQLDDGGILLVTVLAGSVGKCRQYCRLVFGAGGIGTSDNLPQEPTHMVLGHDSDTACQLEESLGVQHLTREVPGVPIFRLEGSRCMAWFR